MNFLLPSKLRSGNKSRKYAFSLVETVLALGIVGFAVTAVVGLLPLGLKNFRHAIDLNARTEVVRDLVSLARQTPFAELSTLKGPFLFDDSGIRTTSDNPNAAISVSVHIEMATEIPSPDGYSNQNLARLQIEMSRPGPSADRMVDAQFTTYIARTAATSP